MPLTFNIISAILCRLVFFCGGNSISGENHSDLLKVIDKCCYIRLYQVHLNALLVIHSWSCSNTLHSLTLGHLKENLLFLWIVHLDSLAFGKTWVICTKYWHSTCSEIYFTLRGRRGSDHMVVGFTTTYAISAYHHWCCEF
jgi:hypothetical protein